jgi:Fe-S cluster assembly iron-binding protein IscA
MWKCTACGELLEDSFDACWNCGTNRHDVQGPNVAGEELARNHTAKTVPPGERIDDRGAPINIANGRIGGCPACGHTTWSTDNISRKEKQTSGLGWFQIVPARKCDRCSHIWEPEAPIWMILVALVTTSACAVIAAIISALYWSGFIIEKNTMFPGGAVYLLIAVHLAGAAIYCIRKLLRRVEKKPPTTYSVADLLAEDAEVTRPLGCTAQPETKLVVELTERATIAIRQMTEKQRFSADTAIKIVLTPENPGTCQIQFDLPECDGRHYMGESHGITVLVSKDDIPSLSGRRVDFQNGAFVIVEA